MATKEIDVEDVAPLIILPIAAGMVLEVWSLTIDVFGGFDFNQALMTIGGASISPALLLSVGSVVAILATNEIDGSSYEQYEYGMIIGALGIVPAVVFVPAIGDLVLGTEVVAGFVWLMVAGVSTYLAYAE